MAEIKYVYKNHENISYIGECYYLNQECYDDLKTKEYYYIDGEEINGYCIVDGTTNGYKYFSMGLLEEIAYDNKLYSIGYADFYGKPYICHEIYFEDLFHEGYTRILIHNENGPAERFYKMGNGKITEYYALHGKSLNKQEWEKQVATKLYW